MATQLAERLEGELPSDISPVIEPLEPPESASMREP